MKAVILQDQSSPEVRACLKAAVMGDERIAVLRSGIFDLHLHEDLLRSGHALPVGSVEFVREAMSVAGVPEPAGLSYPSCLTRFLRRDVRQVRAGSVLGRCFVKPLKTKLFTGFVFDILKRREDMDAFEREQYDAFMEVPDRDLVWCCDPVEFLSEWRYYVRGGQVIGEARYDAEGSEDAPKPDECVVREIVDGLPFLHPCAVDVGVLESGETALVEVNDAWAIGLYAGALGDKDYLEFLSERWGSIIKSSLKQVDED